VPLCHGITLYKSTFTYLHNVHIPINAALIVCGVACVGCVDWAVSWVAMWHIRAADRWFWTVGHCGVFVFSAVFVVLVLNVLLLIITITGYPCKSLIINKQ